MEHTFAPLMSVKQVAAALGIHSNTAWNHICDGEILAVKVGRRTMVHPDDLRAYIDAHRGPFRDLKRRSAPGKARSVTTLTADPGDGHGPS
jgi:excisionase family DNA binding protein